MLFPDKAVDVLLLSCDYVIQRGKDNPGKDNATREDQLVEEALQRRGVRTDRRSWSDQEVNWEEAGCVLVRTPWDYVHAYQDFFPWLKNTARLTDFINSAETLLWNIDKHYLQDLAEAGVEIVPSIFIEKGEAAKVVDLLEKSGWEEVVLKPCISGGARHTYRFRIEDAPEYEETFQQLIAEEAMIIQPFIEEIISMGECSFMFFDGTYSFTTLKKAKAGDYRVQDDFGGTVALYEPTAEEISFAQKVVDACPELPAYARVDCIPTESGALLLSEIELIEPELWFRIQPEAAESLAEAVVNRLNKKQTARV